MLVAEMLDKYNECGAAIDRDNINPQCSHCSVETLDLVDFVVSEGSEGGLLPVWHCGECLNLFKGRTARMETALQDSGELHTTVDHLAFRLSKIPISEYEPMDTGETLGNWVTRVCNTDSSESMQRIQSVVDIQLRLDKVEERINNNLEFRVKNFNLE